MHEQKNPVVLAVTVFNNGCERPLPSAASHTPVVQRTLTAAVLSLLVSIGLPGGIQCTWAGDARDDASPWGVGTGAEWFGAYPKFNPLLRQAGVTWLRGFYEWQTIQPSQGTWSWKLPDALVANARANNIHLVAMLHYLAPWVSADGGTRKFPIKDMQYWRDYVNGVVTRYHNDIKYWEVWNEFNGSFSVNGTPKIYADLVRDAYDTAKQIDPTAKIGMSVANFDVGFLNSAIKAGAADHFDYLCVHPYEILSAVTDNGEVDFLSMAGNLRLMLAANQQPPDMPLWITEIGIGAPNKPGAEADHIQAEVLAKAYFLSLASGFQRIFWFEAHGLPDGKGLDFGLIRPDWTLRPSYEALKTISHALGAQPRYLGWLDLDHGGYGLVFQGEGGNILAAWSPPNGQHKMNFTAKVRVIDIDLANHESALGEGEDLKLTGMPRLIIDVPAFFVQQARSNKGKPFPWDGGYGGGDYAHAGTVTTQLQVVNLNDGLRQIEPGTTAPVVAGDMSWRRTDFSRGNEGHYVYFRVHPQFAPFGTSNLEITAVVRRVAPEKDAGLNLAYESLTGYTSAPQWLSIPAVDQWHELTWKVTDANFTGAWGWNFRLNAVSSPNELYVKEVRVRKWTSP